MTPGDDDGELISVGGRDAFLEVETADDIPECDIDIVHRKYEKDDDPVNKEWEELVSVELAIAPDSRPETLCAAATTLATAIVARLPSV
jgi:hypothetical protein